MSSSASWHQAIPHDKSGLDVKKKNTRWVGPMIIIFFSMQFCCHAADACHNYDVKWYEIQSTFFYKIF